MDEERDEYGRRRLTEREQTDLIERCLVGIWSTITDTGTIHSVPVHFARSGDQIVVLTEMDSQKCRNALRSGRATFCVETTLGGIDRRFVMLEGPVGSRRVASADVGLFRARYGDWDPPDEDDDRAVILALNPELSVAWSDAD